MPRLLATALLFVLLAALVVAHGCDSDSEPAFGEFHARLDLTEFLRTRSWIPDPPTLTPETADLPRDWSFQGPRHSLRGDHGHIEGVFARGYVGTTDQVNALPGRIAAELQESARARGIELVPVELPSLGAPPAEFLSTLIAASGDAAPSAATADPPARSSSSMPVPESEAPPEPPPLHKWAYVLGASTGTLELRLKPFALQPNVTTNKPLEAPPPGRLEVLIELTLAEHPTSEDA